MTQLTSYVCCFGDLHPKIHQPNLNQQNIMLGGAFLEENTKQSLRTAGYILDDQGDNISQLNPHFGDLTGMYWVWKNSDVEWPAMAQYRRFWLEHRIAEVLPFNEKTIYIPQPQTWQSVMSHYVEHHGSYGINRLFEHALREDTKLMHDHVYSLHHIYTMHPYNMLFCHKDLFDKVCTVLFEILFDIYDQNMVDYIEETVKTDPYQKRLPAFLTERLLSILYVNKKYFFGQDIETKVVEMVWI
jgi:hypothetical protein